MYKLNYFHSSIEMRACVRACAGAGWVGADGTVLSNVSELIPGLRLFCEEFWLLPLRPGCRGFSPSTTGVGLETLNWPLVRVRWLFGSACCPGCNPAFAQRQLGQKQDYNPN